MQNIYATYFKKIVSNYHLERNEPIFRELFDRLYQLFVYFD
jgi:hypothetical protein